MTTQTTATVPGTKISLYDQATWSRATVADGKWLQNETLEPISANDRILASAINYVSGGVDDLTYRIDLLEDASDVINVYGTWTDFVTHSGELFDSSAITNNDIIKVLNDPNKYPDLTADGGHQTYFRWSADNGSIWPLDPTEGQWEYIGYIEPYYNKNEVDTIIDDLSGTVDDRIDNLSATVKSEYVPWTASECPIGTNNTATNNAFAQGEKNTAGYGSIAQGLNSSAVGASFAQGQANSALNSSLSQGSNNISKESSFAQGNTNSADTYSFAQGNKNNAYNYAFAQGSETTALNSSLSLGYRTYANNYSIAQGLATSAIERSQAFGIGTSANSSGMAIGVYNKTYDGAFIIGNGTDNSHRSDLFLINKTGDTTSIGAAYFTGFSGTNISGLTQTASIDNLINSAANGGGMTAVKSISGFTIDNSTGPTQEIELQSSADHLNIALSGSIKNSITLYGQQDTYGNHYLYIQGTELLKTADFDDWATSTASVFSGTSRSAQSAYSAQKAASAAIAYSATSAHNAEYLGAKLPSAYMQVANIGRDANGNISSYGGSAIAGLGDYVEKSARNCTIGSANSASDNAFDVLVQGCNNYAVDRSLAQGYCNSAYYCSMAEGLSNKANCTAMAQGYGNSAYEQSLAQGYYNSATFRSIAVGFKNSANDGSCSIGSANSSTRDGVALGDENTASFQSLALGSYTSAANYGLALGYNAISQNNSISVGNQTSANEYCIAVGHNVSAENRSIAVGSNDLKAGNTSLVVGITSTAYTNSLSLGSNNNATYNGITLGNYNSAYSYSLAQGNKVSASDYSEAFGEGTVARAHSLAQGKGNSAVDYSQAFGIGTIANSGGMAIGSHNKTYDAAFVIGNGTNDSNRSDLVVIDHSGNMSITAIYPTKYCSATYSPSGIHLDDSVPNGYDVYLTNEGVITTGYEGSTSIPMSARWLDIIDPRKNYVSAMGELPIVINAVTRLPTSLVEGIYYLV